MKKSIAVLTFATLVFAGLGMSAEAKKSSNPKPKVFNSMVVTALDTNSGDNKLTLTVQAKNGTSYIIDATTLENTKKIMRRNNAKADFSEIMAKDNLKVWGTLSGTTITAMKIRDNSIYKLGSSLKGTIESALTNTANDDGTTLFQFNLSTRKHGNLLVESLSTTPLKYHGQSKTFNDLHQGNTVEIKGLWNKANSKIYNTTRIKITRLAPTTP